MKSCSVDGCTKKHEARGLCSTHYARFKRNGAPVLVTAERDTDLIGRKFSRLLVIGREHDASKGRDVWVCKCDCGNTSRVATGTHLLSENTKSCGCLKINSPRKGTHHRSRTPEHHTWMAMKKRCYNESEPGFENYGGRGIAVCDEWLNSFEAFYLDMGARPKGTSLDRMNNELGYSKENCRWATRDEQNTNKRSNWKITAFGETRLLRDWAIANGVNRTTIATRIRELGWSPEKAVSTPARRMSRGQQYQPA